MRYLGRPVCEIFFFIVLVCAVFYVEEGLVEGGWSASKTWRVKTLARLDSILEEAAPFSARSFTCVGKTHHYREEIQSLQEFSCKHGYFSTTHPLVGFVTQEVSDIQIVENLFASLIVIQDPAFLQMVVGEVVAKVLAYRNLQKGMRVQIPACLNNRMVLAEYRIDEVLDLWQGMPAFGLLPSNPDLSPIILFRGTDFSLLSKQSWASVLSDLDVSGVGFTLFQKARPQIHDWLVKAHALSGQKVKVTGFSLGGILSLYTAIFEKDLILVEESLVFNAPGLPEDLACSSSSLSFTQYVTQGDPVSKLGDIPPRAYMLSSESMPSPIKAHTMLMAGQPLLTWSEICTDEENACRHKQ